MKEEKRDAREKKMLEIMEKIENEKKIEKRRRLKRSE